MYDRIKSWYENGYDGWVLQTRYTSDCGGGHTVGGGALSKLRASGQVVGGDVVFQGIYFKKVGGRRISIRVVS